MPSERSPPGHLEVESLRKHVSLSAYAFAMEESFIHEGHGAGSRTKHDTVVADYGIEACVAWDDVSKRTTCTSSRGSASNSVAASFVYGTSFDDPDYDYNAAGLAKLLLTKTRPWHVQHAASAPAPLPSDHRVRICNVQNNVHVLLERCRRSRRSSDHSKVDQLEFF